MTGKGERFSMSYCFRGGASGFFGKLARTRSEREGGHDTYVVEVAGSIDEVIVEESLVVCIKY